MKEPTKKDLLDEIRRLRAENERLSVLVQTQRPELEQLRKLECRLRDLVFNLPMRLTEAHEMAVALLPPNSCDLPTVAELQGIMGSGPSRVEAALKNNEALRRRAIAPK